MFSGFFHSGMGTNSSIFSFLSITKIPISVLIVLFVVFQPRILDFLEKPRAYFLLISFSINKSFITFSNYVLFFFKVYDSKQEE
jgi:hypothetical protein